MIHKVGTARNGCLESSVFLDIMGKKQIEIVWLGRRLVVPVEVVPDLARLLRKAEAFAANLDDGD